MKKGQGQAGFTLVEMMVALAIFAGLAAMGVAMLRASVDTQTAVQGRLASMSGFQRLRSVMAHDLSQALVRETRDESGARVPAFIGNRSEFAFVQAGTTGLDAREKPDVVRLLYAFEAGEWRRAEAAWLDGAAMPDGDALAREVAQAALLYRDQGGQWHESWPVADDGISPALPSALELTLSRKSVAPLKMLFLLAPMPVLPIGAESRQP